MKTILVIGLVIATLGLLAGFAIPVFAHGPDEDVPANQEAWESMHEACEIGDWEAMAEAAEEVHGEDFDSMPCHGEDYYAPDNHGGGMGSHMGRGMMGW
ncbi:hypothetical protein ACFLTR_00670 [Chloroflexota bacterium]